MVKIDTLKTYYESSIKEYVHVDNDLVMAEEAAFKLISLDPNWSISYQELGDIYMDMGYYRKALKEYRKAKELVLPRYAVSLFKEAHCLERMNCIEEALETYKELLKFDPYNISSGVNGLKLARKTDSESVDFFENIVNKWKEDSLLPDHLKEVLV